jgi:hypothetical protein
MRQQQQRGGNAI